MVPTTPNTLVVLSFLQCLVVLCMAFLSAAFSCILQLLNAQASSLPILPSDCFEAEKLLGRLCIQVDLLGHVNSCTLLDIFGKRNIYVASLLEPYSSSSASNAAFLSLSGTSSLSRKWNDSFPINSKTSAQDVLCFMPSRSRKGLARPMLPTSFRSLAVDSRSGRSVALKGFPVILL